MTATWMCVIPLYAATWCANGPAPMTALTLEGRAVDGLWLGINDGQTLLLEQQGRKISLPLTELLSLSWASTTTIPATSTAPATGPAAAGPGRAVILFLRDGSSVSGRLTAGDAKTLTIETPFVSKWSIPLTRVAGIRFTANRQADAQAAFDRALAERDAAQDTLVLASEGKVQTLRGVVESLAPAGGAFRWRERTIPVPPDRAAGVVFAAAAAGSDAKPPAACHLDDGSVWCGSIVAGDRDSLTLKLGVGQQIQLPLRNLREIRFLSDKVTFLSDLEPAKFEFEPFGSTQWPWQRDRSVTNHPLCIAGRSFTRGLGVHSRSTLTYALDGKASQLAGTIGIDDGARPRGNVVFRVVADGKEVFNSGPVTGQDAPRPILVPLHNAKSLQLIVDFGQDLDLGDQADWCDVRVIR